MPETHEGDNERSPNERPLSAVLQDISDHPDARITLAELTERFGGRAIGALMLIFGLACTLPLPPGATTIFGIPLLIVAPQLALGAASPWLPDGLSRRSIAMADLRAGLPRAIRWLERLEAVSRPRLTFLFNPLGERAVGLVCTVLALVLILPIPLGNMLPALAVSVLSFSVIQRDGAMTLVGYALALASASILALAAHIIVRAFLQAWAVFSPG